MSVSDRISKLTPEQRALFEKLRETQRKAAARPAQAPPVRPRGESATGDWPLSFDQQRLWFLDRLTPGTGAFNLAGPLRLRGRFDSRLLDRCFDEIFRRHETLRTRFGIRDGAPVQIIDPPSSRPLPRVDLAGLPEPVRQREAEWLAAQEQSLPFDLGRGPLLRPILLRLDPGEHFLLLTMHHIATDGWSFGILYQEIVALCEAFAAGRPSPLPEPPVQYADYAIWQRERLEGEGLEALLAYWRERLDGAPQVLDLPLDRPRPAVQTFRGATEIVVLPRPLADRVKAFAAAEGASLFMALLAGFEVLLHRFSGQEDVLVGSPIAGRSRPELEGLIGLFLNSLVLRTSFAGQPGFRELLRRVRETALGAYAHQDMPFEKLLQELRPERDLSRTPMFQVFFNMLNYPFSSVQLLNGVSIESVGSPEAESRFDITLYAGDEAQGIRLYLNYNADLFDRARIVEMLHQYQRVLEQAVASPETPVGHLSLLTGAVALPDPAAPLGREWRGAVHELFVERARLHPERPAVVDAEGAWTYADVEAASRRIAARLRAAGVGTGDRVAVWAHRSAPLVPAIFGILRAGAAFVLLDPAYPALRLAETVRLAGPKAWIDLAAAGAVPAEVEAAISGLPRLTEEGEELPFDDVATGPDDLAYVAFTSGSTGQPKGILGRHGPLSHFLPWQRERFDLRETDRYSLLSGLSHDPLQRDVFTSLCLGATLCVPTLEEIATPGRLAAWMAAHGITVAHLTPAMGQVLTEPGPGAPSDIPALRWIFLVGDALTRLDVSRLQSLAPNATCVNLYGSTETQRAVGYHIVEPGEADAERAAQVLPLGRGMRDVQLLVLNPAGHLAGVGELGEICVRSPHLAKGYLGDEALTAERFRPNPFSGDPEDRIYRTGDLGRYLPSGEVAFAGRADQQVKIRGFRIELSEIEAALCGQPGVREAVVLLRQDARDRRLVAYLVADEPDLAALRDGLRERLPSYMVPAAFVVLDRLPVTPNGKVDRRALAKIEPEGLDAGLETAFVEPQSELESAIAAVWREVLGLERVGVQHNFFDLGGHSLLLVRLHARLQEALRRELTLVDLFNYPSIRALAQHLGRPASAPAALEMSKARAQRQIEAARRQKELARARRESS